MVIQMLCEQPILNRFNERGSVKTRAAARPSSLPSSAPAFIVVLLGIMSFGGYFWLAHSVQQLANDSARAAVAGLNASERQQLARSTQRCRTMSSSALQR
jgi:hypothetical protein